MARCGCADPSLIVEGCSCVLTAGDNTTVTGTGQVDAPWVVSAAAPFASVGVIVYDTAGTVGWTKAANPTARWLHVRAVGGGGGSASTGATLAGQGIARGGGGGGTYAESWIDVATLGPSTTVTVGAGGIAGSPAGTATAGGTGGTSSFGALVVAPGGPGSSATPASSATPSVSAGGGLSASGTGQVQVQGEAGGPGVWSGAAAGGRWGGSGGASGNGMGGAGPVKAVLGSGAVGRPGGGGAVGPVQDGATGGSAGSVGGTGIVVVEMFL